ncbi:unnamed protein product [Chironomus riparius]|uniref:Uncharacterized protein n=1 Tax=Chironomus riparius TaxID=315576 RepID=A0A9P0NBP6_9DIPT|nr:unnamed protein product [Chironomus riparius]
MEVVALSGNSNNAPFKREVHEWQHIDAKTGALLSGRAEANRYVNGNMNTYGKSLLQSFETSDGTKHKQHKQMDILQTITPTGGALQVVRAQIQTSHSSSRRAITSTTYSHYTNGTSTAAVASDVNSSMSSDLLSINPRPLQQHSPTSSRMKALLSSSSYFNSSPTATNDGNSSNNRKTDLFHHINNKNNNINNDLNNGVGSVEAEFSRQQQMNEMLYGSKESNSFLRGKSASIEDLANIDDDDDVKPYDWKRVSKIRRSLQFPKTSETSRGRVNFIRSSRPADLPENSVNVWKIRQNIENSENMRRLSNASKTSTSSINSNGFVALDTILKTETSPMDSLNSNQSKEESKTDCLTAESLQEIRKRLKKLSVDESSPSPKFNEEFLLTEHENTNLNNQKLSLEQNCKSLELRKNKERDISAEDWLNRRKSYGFEKMYQPNESSSSLGGIESSTDSGLGRSSDLPSNWSPTIDSPQRTIITFGDKTKPAATTSISLFSNPAHHHNHHHHVKASETSISDKPIPMRRKASLERKEEIKRHSIAIDEKVDEHYQHRNSSDRKISLVNLNGPYNDKLTSTALVNDGRHKKVEFCKTEIHFAAESGRVNIVETDGKPPPTNNFRRRRRNSGALLDAEYSVQQESITIDDDEVDKPTIESHFDSVHKTNVTTTVGSIYSSAREDDTDEGQSDTDGLRGILKNKPIKPKPYHLGENLESGSSLWGVRLKPVENQHTAWRHSAELESVLTGKKSTEDALEIEFKNLVKAMDQEKLNNNTNSQSHYQSSTVSSNGYSTKINLSSLPTIQQQHPVNKDSSSSTSTSSTATTTHKPTTFTSYNDSRQTSGNVLPDKDQRQKGGHKISIDLKLPHPSSMDTIMDELKSTSLIIKTMKSTSYFDDAMKHFEQESPLIRTSSLRLNNESLSKSSSTSMMLRNKSNAPVRYTSSLDGDHGILDGPDKRDDDFDFLNGFLEENRKFQMSIEQKEKENHNFSQSSSTSSVKSTQAPVAAPRLKKIMNPSQQLSQQLSQLKHLYDIANDSDENAMADEEVKSFLSKNEEEKSISELSGSWSRVRVKKIASAFQSASSSAATTTTGDGTKWAKTPLTSLYENSTSSSSAAATIKPVTIEAAPRTSLIQIGSNHEKVNNNSNIYSNVNTIQQDNSVKVNIQNFESLSPALSRSNSLRIKRDNVSNTNNIGTKDDSSTLKLSTGTRQLKAHELTYFGIKGTPITRKTSDTNITNKSQFTHLSTSSSTNILSSSNKLNISNNSNNLSDKRIGIANKVSTTSSSSTKVTINHQKPDLIMHHHQKIEKSSTPELTTSEKKSMLETLDSCIDETKNLEPIYENLYQNNKYERKLDLARDKKILDELARAADEIMNTCKEMYHADSEEKKRKSLLVTSNGTCLETIKEGTEGRQLQQQLQQQQHSCSDAEQPKVMKSKGVQVSRNFEDSLRRYHRMQQRTSSQSSIESLPRNSKISTTIPSVTTRTRRTTKSGESTASTTISSTKSSSSCRKRENGTGSDGSKRIQRVSSRERMHKSNASSSESDHPNTSTELPRRPRRTKVVKSHREEAVKDEKKSSRVTEASSSSRRSTKPEHNSTSKETKVRSSVLNKSSTSANPNTSILSTTTGGITTSSSRSKSRR